VWIATGGYCGYIRIVPATFGSLLGLLCYVPLAMLPGHLQVVLTGLCFGLGVWASEQAEKLLHRRDARPIVIDEIVGIWVAMLFLPCQIEYLLGAFFVFRLFDVLKPFPANQAERLPGGMGIMLDDVIAGLYTNAVLHGIHSLR
jgi:phosphatidylglycerophosphatase A